MDRNPLTTSEKNWWTPVWRGLVVHPEGKHVRQMSKALALALYLFSHADRRSGRLVRKYGTIAHDMGFPIRTIRAWMRRLEFYEYIRITKTGRAMVVEVLNWRPIGQGRAALSGTTLPVRVAGNGQGTHARAPEREQRRPANSAASIPNESMLTRDIKRERIVINDSFSDSDTKRGEVESPARLELLAQDLAAGLDDRDHLPRYLWCAQRFPEPLLRRLLSEARATPEREIKRSRAALFAYLLRQHVLSATPQEPDGPRD